MARERIKVSSEKVILPVYLGKNEPVKRIKVHVSTKFRRYPNPKQKELHETIILSNSRNTKKILESYVQ